MKRSPEAWKTPRNGSALTIWWRDCRGKEPDRHSPDPYMRSLSNMVVWASRLLLVAVLWLVFCVANLLHVLGAF